ncbi:hypothetical protein KSP39_PZI018345 [Platanthera zijinensis]|uniref:Uncharacterized protein n=1 Tax=Platanthera zijinensis TaxID=2320716 RepID=A0AAP0FYL9_9ASPA
MAELHSSGNAAVVPAAGIPTSAKSTITAAGPSIAASSSDAVNSGSTVPAPYVDPAAGRPASFSYEDSATPVGSVSAAAPSDISEYSIDSAFDVLDADPVPVPAQSPASTEEDDPDY